MRIPVDLHSHTRHSHGKDSVRDMAAAAHAAGLEVFGFSEHSPRPEGYSYPRDYQEDLLAGFHTYADEVLTEKRAYAGRMDILLGLEMDYMPDEKAFARDAVMANPYEYVIGSVHYQGLWGFDFCPGDWEALSDAACADIFARYYQDQERMAKTGLFQIAGHPDLVKLFRKQTFDAWVLTCDAREHIRAALAAMKTAGMAMEISSAALRKGLGEPYPGPEIMRLAREADICIAFGSDAHATADVGFALDDLCAYAARFGFDRSVFFRNKTVTVRPFP